MICRTKIQGDFELEQFAGDTSIICQYEPGEKNATKIGKVLDTERYLQEKQLTLNADKTVLLFYARDELEANLPFTGIY